MNVFRWLSACIVAVLAVAVLVVALANSSAEGRAWLSTLVPAQPTPTPAPIAAQVEQTFAKGDAATALQLARRALAAGTTDASADYAIGNIAQRAGDDSTAVLAYADGESKDAQYVWNFIALGQASARLGRLGPAEMQLRRAVELAPTMQFLHYDLAMVELAEHQPASALQNLNAELRISPGFKPAVQSRRVAFRQLARLRGRVIAQASPSPSPTAAATPGSSPQATATPTLAPSLSPVLAHLPVPAAHATIQAPSSNARRHNDATVLGATLARAAAAARATQPPAGDSQTRIPIAAPTATPEPTPPPTMTPLPASVAADARAYLLAVSHDLGFTQALPAWDPGLSTQVLAQRLSAELARRTWSIDALLRIGTSALVSGRLALAERAFDAASARGRSDWRGPYLQALTARAAGDDAGAIGLLRDANARAQHPETYTSLAIIELEIGDTNTARASAERAVSLQPGYEPGRFTAGMLALIQNDPAAAAQDLGAATNLAGMPARTSYFFGLVSER